MPLYQVLVLAIVQGLTEFLPISSSAHLALVPWLFGWQDPGLTFDIALHLGTLVAVLLYFFRDWLQVLAAGFGLSYGNDPEIRHNPKLLWYLVLGTLPVVFFGALFHDAAETTLRQPYIIGTMLIVIGLLMGLAERVGRRRKDLGHVSLTDSLVIGLAQALAIVPGTSRSGITITAALFRDITRPDAARFSFLLSTPAIAGAAAKSAYDLYKEGGVAAEMRTPFLVGMLISGLVGYFVIAVFLRYLRANDLRFFVVYRIIFGIIVIALALGFRYTAG